MANRNPKFRRESSWARFTDHGLPQSNPNKFITRVRECYYRGPATNQGVPRAQRVLACSMVRAKYYWLGIEPGILRGTTIDRRYRILARSRAGAPSSNDGMASPAGIHAAGVVVLVPVGRAGDLVLAPLTRDQSRVR